MLLSNAIQFLRYSKNSPVYSISEDSNITCRVLTSGMQ